MYNKFIKLKEGIKMTFSKWKRIYDNKELLEVCLNIQENFLDDYLNFDDHSVGIYSVGYLNSDIVKEINEGIEGIEIVEFKKHKAMLSVDDKYYLQIDLVNNFDYDEWQIANIHERKYFFPD
jgi:hypothetical protein